jgi:tetratricopeptide (TPR) repeat protein
VQQFYDKARFAKFLDENFVLFRAQRGTPLGEKLYKKFNIQSTPFLLFLGPDGKEVDWIAGYTPPPEKLQDRMFRILKGVDTLPSLARIQCEDPENPEPLIKLGIKYQEHQYREKALECFKEAAALDPDGAKMMKRDTGEMISCKEMADYQFARTFAVTFGLIDVEAAHAYIRNYPSGQLLKEAYLEVSRFHRLENEEGRAFFDEFVAKFPDDPDVLNAYVEKAHRASQALQTLEGNPIFDFAVDIAGRITEVYPEISRFQAAQSYAQFLVYKDDIDAAKKAFGEDFLSGQVQVWSDSLLSFAEFWLNQKQNIEEAEEAVVRALNLVPDNPEVLRRAAAAFHVHLGKPDEALGVFGPDILPKISTNARALYDYFKFWMTLETNEDSAENALTMLWRLKPDTVYYRIGAASVFQKADMMEKALAVFGPDFAVVRQDDMPALYEYGIYWVRQSLNLESAVPALTRSLTLSPSTWINHWNAAKALDRIKKPEAVLKVFGPAYLQTIKEDAFALSQYAQYWISKNQNKQSAIEALEMAVRLENLSPSDMRSLVYSLIRAGMLDRAKEIYGTEHLAKIKDDPQALYYYSSFWGYHGKNLTSALEAAELGCQIENENPRQWAAMAQILKGLDRYEEALEAVDKAISLEKFKEDKEQHAPLRKQILEALGKKK